MKEFRRRLCVYSLAALLAVPALSAAQAPSDQYHILLTNDDGIESEGLQVLAQKLTAVGEIHVIAPCGERSGSSMSVALRDQLTLKPVLHNGIEQRCVNTTPGGTVMLGVSALAPENGFDLVVSGINRGANVGTVSHMSGTVGAAMMGAFYGIPGVAVSLGGRKMDFDYAARFVTEFVKRLKEHQPMPGVIFSINIPSASESDIRGVEVRKMAGTFLRIGYREVENAGAERLFRPQISLETEYPAGGDTEGFMNNMITITPLRFDWTAYSVIDELRSWQLGPKLQQ